MGISKGPGVLVLSGCLCVAAAGCRMPRQGSTLAGDASRSEAAEASERAARTSHRPEDRARHYLDAAEAWIDGGSVPDARRCAKAARRAGVSGEAAGRLHRVLGRCHLEVGETVIAARYLRKGLQDATAEERQRTLARLTVCARARCDREGARAWERRLDGERSPEVRAILARRIRARTKIADPRGVARSASAASSPRTSHGPRSSPAAGRRSRRVSGRLVTLPRARWDARPVLRNTEPMTRVTRITVHHTAGPSFWGRDPSAVGERIRSIQRYHQQTNHWADIGYHFLVDRSGRIWQGRDLRFQGAHASRANSGNIGIALLGNYTRQQLSHEQARTLRVFLHKLAKRYRVPADRIYTHRELCDGSTACPGRAVSARVAQVRRELAGHETVVYGK